MLIRFRCLGIHAPPVLAFGDFQGSAEEDPADENSELPSNESETSAEVGRILSQCGQFCPGNKPY